MTVRVSVKAHPSARREEVRFLPPDALEVWLREPPRDGRANECLERLLSEVLGVRRSAVRIVRGGASRQKIVEIDGIDVSTLERMWHDSPS